LLVNESGLEVERTEYFPYGQVQSGGLEKYGFTGQENDIDTGLMYYGARYYSPEYRIFIQPDTLLPDVYNPQALNRYSYALNNPVKYTDPSGHYVESAIDIAFLAMDINDIRTGNANKWTYIGLGADVVCLALPGVTGGRLAVKALEEGVTHGDELAGFFNRIDTMSEAARAANKVDNVYGAAKSTEGLTEGIKLNEVKNKGGQIRRSLEYDGMSIQINTGHGYRDEHLSGGLEGVGTINNIESEIVFDISSAVNSGANIPTQGHIERVITVNNQQVGYHLMQSKDGTYRVSTYYKK
jgi:RHS repeat-associated protein